MSRPPRRQPPRGQTSRGKTSARETELRIIGGELRGRRLKYSGDPVTRPMKDRIREAAFNLIGSDVEGTWCLDLFAGTGALACEALSRGAESAVLLERHFPSARLIEENLRELGLADRAHVVAGDTFFWCSRELQPVEQPWLVFCSPPYALYEERFEALVDLLERIRRLVSPGSLIVIEHAEGFDTERLPGVREAPDEWDIRHYAPAVLAIWRKGSAP